MRTRSSWIWCWIVGAVLASGAGAQQYTTIIDNLPTCTGNRNGRIIAVSDATSDSDCTEGGATGEDRFVHPCICDTLNALGPYWKAVGGGAGGAGDVLLAGDADGQTIQGRSGADKARVDIGETDPDQVTLIGPGATPGRVYAYSGGVYAVSPDGGTSFEIYDQGFEFNTDGAAGLYGGTSTGVGSTEGVLNLAGSRINVHSQQSPPTNANDSCTAGDTIDTATFHYYCEATNSWVRAPMATW
jgi:hypothetical protein